MNYNSEKLFKQHYPALDLLRALAIVMVMLMHFGVHFGAPPDAFFVKFMRWGWNRVALFFALSGFLIGGQIIEECNAGDFSFKRFFIKRFFRIFPPYYFSLLVVSILFFTGFANEIIIPSGLSLGEYFKDLAAHIFYLQNYKLAFLQRGLYWSLAIEEQFYLLLPLLFWFLFKYFGRKIGAALVFLIILGTVVRLLAYDPSIQYSQVLWEKTYRYPFHLRFDSLLYGVFGAWLFIKYNRQICALSLSAKTAMLFIALILLGFCLTYGSLSGGWFNTCWQFTLSGLGFGLLVLWSAISGIDRYIYPKRFVSLIAKYSYTMYLYHLILVVPTIRIINRFILVDSFVDFLFIWSVYFILVFSVSALIYQIIDRPSMNYRKKLLSRMG